jgi:hypothetical protein
LFKIDFGKADYARMREIVLGKQDADIDDDSQDTLEPRSKKAKTSNGKKYQKAEEHAMVTDDGEVEEQPATNSLGKGRRKSMLRPKGATASKKSRALQVNKQAESDSSPSDSENSIDDATGSSMAYVMSSPTMSMDDDISKNNRASSSASTFVQPGGKGPLPAYYEPGGPDDTWICPYDGCNYQVWNAQTSESIEMISKHFERLHAERAEDIIHEESRPWVSVE